MIVSKTEKINKFFCLWDILATILLFVFLQFFVQMFFAETTYQTALQRLQRLPWVLPLTAVLWAFFLNAYQTYPKSETRKTAELLLPVLKSIVTSGSILGLFFFLTKSYIQSRSVFVLFMLADLGIILLNRFLLLKIRNKLMKLNIIIISDERNSRNIEKIIRKNLSIGKRILDIIRIKEEITDERMSEIFDKISLGTVDWIVVGLGPSNYVHFKPLVEFCEEKGVPVSLLIDTSIKPKISWLKVEEISGFPFFTFYTTTGRVWGLISKDIIDKALGVLGIIVLFPLLALISAAVKISSPGTVIFSQIRSGLNGKPFKMLKFRTMREGSEELLPSLLESNLIQGCAFKHPKDPRVTKVGKFLRRWSLDELPQLVNIIKGEMSFVGPRPPLPEEVKMYKNWQKRKLSMKPGLTCLWQIGGRSKILDFDKWVKLDLEYIDNWSLWLDIKIMIKTLPAIISGMGAY
ncbi:sugar transferase [candidate division WOR-3 bacterium]|nr:sugar transferase [candidate division WOR-3 bacterium]